MNEIIEKLKTLTPHKKIISLDTDLSVIMESEGFAVWQFSCVKINAKYLEQIRGALLQFKKTLFSYPVNEESICFLKF